MFCKTSPQQSLLENQFLIPEAKRSRLEKSWAQAFRDKVLPLIDEELYRSSFDEYTGRPNRSIRLLVGLELLKHTFDHTDRDLVEQLEYNLQYQYALGVTSADAHIERKTLHNHRVRTLKNGAAEAMLIRLVHGLGAQDGIRFGLQRLDSTHVISNIAVLSRLGLLTETVAHFVRELEREYPSQLELLSIELRRRYLDREGYFADVKKAQARRRLPVVARDIYVLLKLFAPLPAVRELPSYGLLERLFEEQCELVEPAEVTEAVDSAFGGEEPVTNASPKIPVRSSQEAAAGTEASTPREDSNADEDTSTDEDGNTDADADETGNMDEDGNTDEDGNADADDDISIDAEGNSTAPSSGVPQEPKVQLKPGKQISGDSLQSPYDPDATYGHKGKGYEVQVAETCDTENPYQLITYIDVQGAHESDQKATSEVIEGLQSHDLAPDVMFADTGYGSGENIVAAAVNGVDLQAPVQDPNRSPPRDGFVDPPPAEQSPASAVPTEPFGLEAFTFNATCNEVERCPGGYQPASHEVDECRREPYKAAFYAESCGGCPLSELCPTKQYKGDDQRVLRWRDAKAATATRQRQQQQPDFKERYRIRSGIESTNEELKSRHGARDLRVRGQDRLRMTVFLKATALNIKRACQHAVQAVSTPLNATPAEA